jgi:ribokinase
LGASTGFVGRVGDDDWGRSMTEGLVSERVDVSALSTDPERPTGLAVITIDAQAENTIVASPGANGSLTPSLVREHASLIAEAKVVLAQLEVPTDAILEAASLSSGVFCLNPAPAAAIPKELLERVDVLIPNRSELSLLAGREETVDTTEVTEAARAVLPDGVTVVTLGGDGAVVVEADRVSEYEAHEVEAIDPTGAGDTFCAALAVGLSRGDTIAEAVSLASAAAAIAVTAQGAQAGMPSMDEVEAFLER